MHMSLDIVFNELSGLPIAPDEATARIWMAELVKVVSEAGHKGARRGLRAYEGFVDAEIAPGYPIARWRNDLNVDIVLREKFSLLTVTAPYLEDITDNLINDRYLVSEIAVDGVAARGITCAVLLDGLAVSFLSDEKWDRSSIDGVLLELNNADPINVPIRHASTEGHIIDNSEWIRCRVDSIKRAKPNDGRDLLRRRADIVPRLDFCDLACSQLAKIPGGHPLLVPILERLLDLDSYCETWHEGAFNPDSIHGHVTVDSQATLQMFPDERTCVCPDGDCYTFSWHARLPDGWRLYFRPSSASRRLLIGLVISHPRNVTSR